MSVSIRYIVAVAALTVLGGGTAQASGCCGGGNTGGVTNVPVVTTPAGGGCCGAITGHPVGVPGVFVPAPNISVIAGGPQIGGVNVGVGGPVIGGTTVSVGGPTFNSSVSVLGGGGGGGNVYIGGGGGGFMGPAPVSPGLIENLGIGGQEAVTERVMEARSVTETVAIRAVCIDDRGMPHPASRTDGDEQVGAGFDGEMFRCMAGTRMEVTIGRMVNGQAVFDGGTALSCAKGQALSYRGGQVACTAQIARSECNERSLLRRFGPGIKYATVTRTEQFAAERVVQQASTFRSSMFIDGGVGQGVY
jgi:hypothetical protein